MSVGATLGVVVNSLFISTINTNSGGNWLSLAAGSVSGNTFMLNVGNTTNLNINQQYSGAVTVVAQTTAGQLSGAVEREPAGRESGFERRGHVADVARFGHFHRERPRTGFSFFPECGGDIERLHHSGSHRYLCLASGRTQQFSELPAPPQRHRRHFGEQRSQHAGNVPGSASQWPPTPDRHTSDHALFRLGFLHRHSGGGPAPNGLSVSPSSTLTYNVQTGGSTPSQNVSILYNGNPIAISGVAASLGESFILPSFQSGNIVNVAVNSQGLSPGMYSGSVIVTTSVGQVTIQVNLTVGGAPTLSVSTTSLNFAYQAGERALPGADDFGDQQRDCGDLRRHRDHEYRRRGLACRFPGQHAGDARHGHGDGPAVAAHARPDLHRKYPDQYLWRRHECDHQYSGQSAGHREPHRHRRTERLDFHGARRRFGARSNRADSQQRRGAAVFR